MSILEISLLSVALAMDAMSVSFVSAINTRNNYLFNALKVSLCFGIFQSLMPLVGYHLGDYSNELIRSVGHWISFALLVVIGCDMIAKSLKEEQVEQRESFLGLLLLALATSLDAFAVGITFSFLEVNVLPAIFIIGIITFCLCFLISIVASKIKDSFQKHSQLLGGVILLVIAVKIISEHIIL